VRRTVAVAGDADADVAWERYVVVDRWPTWAPPIRHVEASAARLQPGLTGVVHGPVGIRVSFQVDQVDEPTRTWSWRVRSGPVRMSLRHAVLSRAEGGSVATLTVDGPPWAALVYPELARVALSRLVG
jgi:hypothetical protein